MFPHSHHAVVRVLVVSIPKLLFPFLVFIIDIIPYAFHNKLDRSGRIRDKDEIIMFWISAKKSKGLYSNGVNSVACYSRRR